MMKGCAEATRPHKIKTIVSLNPMMVDGTGMCGGCRVKLGDRVKFACVDGPDFDGHLVDFDDLMFRLQRYKATEREATERFERTLPHADRAATPTGAAGSSTRAVGTRWQEENDPDDSAGADARARAGSEGARA